MDNLFLLKLRKNIPVGRQVIPLFFLLFLYPFCSHTEYALAGLTAEYVGIVVLAVCAVCSLFRKDSWVFDGVDVLFLLFVCWYVWRLSAEADGTDGRMLMKSAGCLLLYFYFRRERPANLFFGLLFGAGVLRALWGILQQSGLLPSCYVWLAGNGGFYNSALWGIFSVMALLAGNALGGHCRSRGMKCLWGAGMLLLLLAVFLSASRASWVALVAGCIWVMGLSERGKKVLGNLRRKYAGIPLFLFGLAVSVCAGAGAYGLYVLRPASVEGRFLIWRVITDAVGKAPWCGHGALSASYMPLQADWFARHPDSAYAMVADNNIYAFNEFLRILFECGTIGLLLFAGMLFAAFRMAALGDRHACHAGGLLAAVMCFGLFGYPLTAVPVAVVAVIALTVIAGGDNHGRPLFRGTFTRWGRWAVMAATVCFLIFCTERYIGGKHADRLLRQGQTEPSVLSDGGLARDYRCWRNDPDFVLCYGKTLYNHARYADALPVLQRAARLKPSSRLLCDLGDCYRHAGNRHAAEASYLSASRMVPARILPHYRLFCLYRDEGMEAEAAAQAERMLTMPVKVVNTSVLRYRHQARLFLSHCPSQNK